MPDDNIWDTITGGAVDIRDALPKLAPIAAFLGPEAVAILGGTEAALQGLTALVQLLRSRSVEELAQEEARAEILDAWRKQITEAP